MIKNIAIILLLLVYTHSNAATYQWIGRYPTSSIALAACEADNQASFQAAQCSDPGNLSEPTPCMNGQASDYQYWQHWNYMCNELYDRRVYSNTMRQAIYGCNLTTQISFNGQCLSKECSDGTLRSELTGLCPTDCPKDQEIQLNFTGSTCPSSSCVGTKCCEVQKSGTVSVILTGPPLLCSATYKYTGYACTSCNTSDPTESPYEPFECPTGQVQKSCPGSSVTYCMAPEDKLDCDATAEPTNDDTPGSTNPNENTSTSNDNGTTTTTTNTDITTTDNGDGTTTTTKTTTTTTTNTDGTTTTNIKTETTTTDASGNVTGQSSTETETKEGDEGESVSGNNQCEQKPICEGSAIACSQLINTWEQKCIAKKTQGYCLENPSDKYCQEYQPPEGGDVLPENEVNLEFGIVELTQSKTCPSDININTSSGTYQLSFGPVCQYAEAFYPFVLITAWLAAGYIVFTVRQ